MRPAALLLGRALPDVPTPAALPALHLRHLPPWTVSESRGRRLHTGELAQGLAALESRLAVLEASRSKASCY
jgi:hypothetical protein